MRTLLQLDADTLALLAPITRNRYDYVGQAQAKTAVNPAGIDLHVGDVGAVANAPDGTAAPYMVLWTQSGTDTHTRLAGGRSITTYGFQLTVAAGTRTGALWAIDRVRTVTARARLHKSTGILTPYFDQINVLVDEGASPPRWYAPLRYTTSVH